MTKTKFPSLIALFSSLLISSSLVHSIRLERGGYTDIRLAIHPSIEEDEELIEDIMEMIANASIRLYKALGGQAYFRDVIVIVPKHWKLENITHEPIFGDHHFSIADVRVDKQNPLFGEYWTYTLQPGVCGEAGKYIHLTDDYIRLSRIDSYFSNSTDSTFVSEWARLRYGVFNEYGFPGDPFYPAVYDNGTHILPTACIDGIYGYLEAVGDTCKFGEQGFGLDNCHYTPDPMLSELKASLMAYPRTPDVMHFCTDNKSNPELFHNRRAPNEHNLMCYSRSTWDVVSKHEDFKSVKLWKGVNMNQDTTPNIIVKRIEDPAARIVLVLDASDNMKHGDKLKYLKESATRFLRDRLPIDSLVAIVACKGISADLTDGLVRIKGKSSLKKVIGIVNNIDASGKSDIGYCLWRGLKMFRYRRKHIAEAGLIVVATSSKAYLGNLEYVLRHIIERRVTVSAIVLGAKGSAKFQDIVEKTGGLFSVFTPGNSDETIAPTELDDAFFSAIMAQTNVEKQPIVISKQNLWLKRFGSSKFSFLVDGDIGMNTKIMVISEHVQKLSLSFFGPSKTMQQFDPRKYNLDKKAKRIVAGILTYKPGRWTLVVNSSASVAVNLDVEVASEAMNASYQPIRLHSWLKAQRIGKSSIMRIYADVKKRYKPVVNAKVIASVKTSNDRISEVTLKDDGTGADVKKNDGIYSEYFLAVREAGPHNVFVRVSNPDHKAKIRIGRVREWGISVAQNFCWPEVELIRNRNITKRLISHFPAEAADPFLERYQYAGAFQVTQHMVNSLKRIPPNRVTDLRVLWTCMSGDKLVATLSCTSPGDNMQTGIASWIELRGSPNWDLLHDNFSDAHLFVNANELKYPPPGGSIQLLNVQVPLRLVKDQLQSNFSVKEQPYISFYFALRAQDHFNNKAEVSNFASARFSPLWNTSFPLDIKDPFLSAAHWSDWVELGLITTAIPMALRREDGGRGWREVGMFVGIACLVFVVIVAIVIKMKQRSLETGSSTDSTKSSSSLHFD